MRSHASAGPALGVDGALEFVRVTRFEYPRDRAIGDAFVEFDMNWFATLELFDRAGRDGLGAFFSLDSPLPPESDLQDLVGALFLKDFSGQSAQLVLNRLAVMGGALGAPARFGIADAFNQALWDLAAKQAGLPLWRYLGAVRGEAPAYASGLCYRMPEPAFERFYANAASQGFDAFKIKLGRNDLDWDLRRLAILREAVGQSAVIMADANEAWTAAETIRRLAAYERARFALYWIEDPVSRVDFPALRAISSAQTATYVNAGEYLEADGKCALIVERVADVVNLHGNFTDGLFLGRLASERSLHVALGNSPFDMGAHLAAVLPNALYVEHSFLNVDAILREPLRIEGGRFRLPDRPGHGLEIDDVARRELRRP